MSEYRMPPWPAVPLLQIPEFVRTEGAYLIRGDGSRVLDAAGQACVSNIGYGRREVADAVAEALVSMTHALPPIPTPQRLQLVERLKDKWLPESLSRILFLNSGSEAAETAMKLARQHHLCAGNSGKWKVIGLEPSYHGVTLAALAAGGHTSRKKGFEPMMPEFLHAPACYPLRCDTCSRDGECNFSCANALEDIIEREGADTIAALIAEPINGTSGGALVPHANYWGKVQEICKRHNILLIVDEVITGFGRTGKRFAIEHWGIEPDILTTAKGFTGGYAPLAAVIATEAVIQPLLEQGEDIMFHTFGGHPGACAAANAVLEIIERESLVERVAEMGDYIAGKVDELETHPNIAQVRGKGLLWAVEIVKNKETLEAFSKEDNLALEILGVGLSHDVFFYPGGTGQEGAIIVLGPAFIITTDEIDTMFDVLVKSIDEAVSKII